MSELKKRRANICLVCPVCEERMYWPLEDFDIEIEATLDCAGCSALLYYAEKTVYLFHEYMHAQDSRWPVDGAGTGSIEVKEDKG